MSAPQPWPPRAKAPPPSMPCRRPYVAPVRSGTSYKQTHLTSSPRGGGVAILAPSHGPGPRALSPTCSAKRKAALGLPRGAARPAMRIAVAAPAAPACTRHM